MDKFIMSVDELNQIIAEAVDKAVAAVRPQKKEMLISREATAKRLNVDLSTLWRWNKTGFLKPVKIGRSVYYREFDLDRLERGEREVQHG